jgi:chlorobactene glucosyltransferase
MEKLWDPLVWLFIVTGLVWVHRGRQALEAIYWMPVVKPFLPPKQPPSQELVTVIIPARNEEKNILACVQSLMNQDYPHLEILIVNNESTDRTETILQALGIPCLDENQNASLPPLPYPKAAYLNTSKTPDGWTGKNFAIHTAISKAHGRWLLFTDADTRHESAGIREALNFAIERDLPFLTLLPRCLTGSFFEHLIQPCAMGFIGLWFPTKKINNPENATYFANGQFLLIHRRLYEKIGGHTRVKGEFLEDFALIKNAKEEGARVQCALGVWIYGTRMYDSLSSIWNGWRRIYLHAFGKKPWMLFTKFLSVLLFSVLPFAIFIPLTSLAFQYPTRYGFTWGVAIPLLLFILLISWQVYGIVKAKKGYSVLHPVAALFVAMILLDACLMAVTNRKTTWR